MKLQIMPFQNFQVLLIPISCRAYNFKIFSTYLSFNFLEVNQKRELEIFCAERRCKICQAQIRIVMFDIRAGKRSNLMMGPL